MLRTKRGLMLVVLLVISMSFSGLAVEEDEDPAVPFKSCYYLGDPAMVFVLRMASNCYVIP